MDSAIGSRELTHATVGERIAGLADGDWFPARDPQGADDLSGHVRVDDVWVYLGMGTSAGEWLQVAYVYALSGRGSEFDDTSACGQGAGTRVIEALRAWVQQSGVPLRIVGIENQRFFRRFDWSEDSIDALDECWQYPSETPAA